MSNPKDESDNLNVSDKDVKSKGGRQPFKKGAFKAQIKMDMFTRPSAKAMFTHEGRCFNQVLTQLARIFHEKERIASNDPITYDEMGSKVVRLFSLAMGSKLVGSFSEDDKLRHGAQYNAYVQPLTLPNCLIPVINNYGPFEHDGKKYKMIGQVAWAMTYIGRALSNELEDFMGNEQPVVNREYDYFVNYEDSLPFNSLLELCVGYVNAWSKSVGIQTFDFGGNIIRMKIPILERGFQTYSGLTANFVTPEVSRMISIGRVIERIGVNQPTALDVLALNEHGVKVVKWKKRDINDRYAKFVDDVLVKIRSSMCMAFKTAEVMRFDPQGSAAQLMERFGDYSISSVRVPGDKLIFGWMLANESVFVDESEPQFGLTNERTQAMELDNYFRAANNNT